LFDAIDYEVLILQGAVTLLNYLFVVTKYTPPCRRSKVVYVKQNRRYKYSNEQRINRLVMLDSD